MAVHVWPNPLPSGKERVEWIRGRRNRVKKRRERVGSLNDVSSFVSYPRRGGEQRELSPRASSVDHRERRACRLAWMSASAGTGRQLTSDVVL